MIVVVTGSRGWAHWIPGANQKMTNRDYAQAYALTGILDGLLKSDIMTNSSTTLVHGGCKTGADAMAAQWALRNMVHQVPFEADWKRHGNSAGPKRNMDMIDWVIESDDYHPIVIACFEGPSKGTTHCAGYAAAKGLEVIELRSRVG